MRVLRSVLGMLLAVEALNGALWAARLVSAAAAYDGLVLFMILLRVAVSALQAISAWMLLTRSMPAVALARLAFMLSAGLLVLEIGLRLSPSSVQPGLRVPLIGAYVVYALACLGMLRLVERADSPS